MPRRVSYYRRLPYTRRVQLVVEDQSRYWHAWVEELPGCEVDGATKPEAFFLLDEVFEDYIKAKLEWDSPIAEPRRWPKLTSRSRKKRTAVAMKRIKPTASPLATVQSSPDDSEAPRSADLAAV
jgi:predicted RNase H-like HicB family nuclease